MVLYTDDRKKTGSCQNAVQSGIIPYAFWDPSNNPLLAYKLPVRCLCTFNVVIMWFLIVLFIIILILSILLGLQKKKLDVFERKLNIIFYFLFIVDSWCCCKSVFC
jgi:hypothetical protein